MSEAVQNHPDERRPEQQDVEALRAVENKTVFPDYDLDIKPRQFVSDVIEITPSQRLRVAANALSDTHPSLENLQSSNERKRIFQAKKDFVRDKSRELKQPTNTIIKLVEDSAANEVFDELRRTNHPTYQLLAHIQVRFGEEVLDKEFKQLSRDLITLSAWSNVKAAAKNRLASDQETS